MMSRFISRDTKYFLIIILVFLTGSIETDIYLPAFPDMMDFFKTNEETIQNILSWNFLGICLSCPFYGPLSDSFGRRWSLLGALGLFLLGSIGTVFATSIEQMLLYRIFQGLGTGGCFTIGSAITFDVWQEKKAVKVVNITNYIIPIAMAGAPILGGYLNQMYGFRSNFIAIALCALASFILCVSLLEETHPVEKRKPFDVPSIMGDFFTALRCWGFWAPTLMICCSFAGYLTYVSNISILFVNHMDIDVRIFPLYQTTILLGFVSASLLANRLIDAWGIQTVKKRGLILSFVGGIGFVVSSLFTANSPNIFQIWMTIFAFGAGWMVGPFFVEGMESLPEIKGVVGSLMTSFRLAFTAIMINLTGRYFDGTVYPLVYAIGGALLIKLLVLFGSYSKKEKVSSGALVADV